MWANNQLSTALDELELAATQVREGRALERSTRFYALRRRSQVGSTSAAPAATVIELNNGRVLVTWPHDPSSLAIYPSMVSARIALCADGAFVLTLEEASERRAVVGETYNRTVDLSEAEKQTLLKLSHGLTNGEISQQLDTAESTIKNRLYIIFRKLGVHDRLQAALMARDLDLLPGQRAAEPELAKRPSVN